MAGKPVEAAADNTDALAAAHQALRADPNLQFNFPEIQPPPPPPPWAEALGRFLRLIAPLLNDIFWAGAALIVGLILFFLIRESARRWPGFGKRKQAAAAPAPLFQPTTARARALLEEADRLAREGRYSEAARVLLHRSIEDIENAFRLSIGPAATSREIAQLDPLSPRGRDVFTRIALAVETSLFGGRALDASGYAACREAYSDFALGARP